MELSQKYNQHFSRELKSFTILFSFFVYQSFLFLSLIFIFNCWLLLLLVSFLALLDSKLKNVVSLPLSRWHLSSFISWLSFHLHVNVLFKSSISIFYSASFWILTNSVFSFTSTETSLIFSHDLYFTSFCFTFDSTWSDSQQITALDFSAL